MKSIYQTLCMKFLLFMLCTFILCLKISAQNPSLEFVCNQTNQTTTTASFDASHSVGACASYNGSCHTPKGNLHIMFLYVGFTDETTTASNVPGWDFDKLPDYAQGTPNDLIDNTTTLSGRNNLSKWYKTMTNGYFTVTGEAFFVKINRSTDFDVMTFNAVQQLQANYPNEDWSRFDNRQNLPYWGFDNSAYFKKTDGTFEAVHGDGIIDYLVIDFRYTNGGGAEQNTYISNGATLITNFNGGKTYNFNCGHKYYACQANKDHHEMLFKHEFGHAIYDAPHYFGANNVVGERFYRNHGWGMMSETHRIINTTNAWEEWWLNWMTIQNVTTNGTYTIKDFVTENDAIRIPIPKTNQFLWIENHQKINALDDKVIYKNESPNTTGIYAYITTKGGDCLDVDEAKIFAQNTCNSFKVLSSKGNFDYDWTPITNNVPRFDKIASNPISGQTDLTTIRKDFNSDGTIYVNTNNNSCYPPNEQDGVINNAGSNNYAFTGSVQDVFQVNDEIGLSGIVPALNYPVYNNFTTKRLEPFILNGLSVKITNYNSTTKEFEVEVEFDNWNINTDKRWTGNMELQNLSNNNNPDLIVKSNVTLTINKSGTPNTHVSTSYPDFIVPSVLTCKSGSTMKLEADAYVVVDEGSTLKLEANSKLEINDGAELRIKNNSYFQIDGSAEVVVNSGGKVIIENTGFLLYNGNGTINLNNPNSIIEIKDGGKIKISSNATFNYSGNGYLLFEDIQPIKRNIIAGGTNAKFSIDGIDRKKVIEVTGNGALYPDDALELFEIKSAKVILNENTGIIAGCPIKLFYVDILPHPNYPNLKHRGLQLYGQKNADLNLLTVVSGIRGVTAYNNVYGNDLKITSYKAIGCGQGLWVNDKGVKIVGGVLTNNSKQGMFLNAQSNPSEFWMINASNCLSGADVIGNKGALARFFYPNIQGNGSGIFASNSTITANCGYIKNNNNYNVYLKDNSLLDLDPAHILGVGMIDFSSTSTYDTPYLIKLDKAAHGPYLNSSKSNLVSSNWKIWGDLRDISTLFSFLYSNITVNNNYWSQPTGLKLPIYNSDYKVTYTIRSFPFNNPSATNLDYEDHFPLSTSPNIGSCNPFNNTTMSITNGLTNKYAADGSNLSNVLKAGVDKLYDNNPDIEGAVADFKTILQTSFTSAELYDWTVPITYTLDKLYEAVAKGLQDNTYTLLKADNSDADIFTSTVAIYNTWISNFIENEPVKFSIELNKALFYRLFNKRTSCLSQLNAMSATVDLMDLNLLDYYICVLDKEVKMANNEIDREDYYVFDDCVAMLNIPSDRSIPSVTLEKNKVKNKAEINTSVNSLTVFKMFPNPAANQLNLAFNATGKESFTIEIFDILGKSQLFLNKSSEKDNYVTINTENLSAGSYFLKMNVDGIYKTEKFVIAK